jgi:hypothetical protein
MLGLAGVATMLVSVCTAVTTTLLVVVAPPESVIVTVDV